MIINKIREYFNPENVIIRKINNLKWYALRHNFTTLPGVLSDLENQFKSRDEVMENWSSLPHNDGDLDGIYDYLIWSAVRSGWSSDKLHYIETLYIKAQQEEISL